MSACFSLLKHPCHMKRCPLLQLTRKIPIRGIPNQRLICHHTAKVPSGTKFAQTGTLFPWYGSSVPTRIAPTISYKSQLNAFQWSESADKLVRSAGREQVSSGENCEWLRQPRGRSFGIGMMRRHRSVRRLTSVAMTTARR